jgi:hypothetical protein
MKRPYIVGLIIMAPSLSQPLSFPGLTGESRKALDARLRHADMTWKREWALKGQINREALIHILLAALRTQRGFRTKNEFTRGKIQEASEKSIGREEKEEI